MPADKNFISEARDIDEVLDILDAIIDRCMQDGDRAGLFTAMYRRTTAEIKEGIETGRFDDADRMNRLDTVFANRFLRAYRDWRLGRPICRSWKLCFESTLDPRHSLYQHLLLGMNAHINFDLGPSVVDIADGKELPPLKRDFLEVNKILNHMIDGVQETISHGNPALLRLDRMAGRFDEWLVYQSIRFSRGDAWLQAEEMLGVDPARRQKLEGINDRKATRFGHIIKWVNPARLPILGPYLRIPESAVPTIIEKMQLSPED